MHFFTSCDKLHQHEECGTPVDKHTDNAGTDKGISPLIPKRLWAPDSTANIWLQGPPSLPFGSLRCKLLLPFRKCKLTLFHTLNDRHFAGKNSSFCEFLRRLRSSEQSAPVPFFLKRNSGSWFQDLCSVSSDKAPHRKGKRKNPCLNMNGVWYSRSVNNNV